MKEHAIIPIFIPHNGCPHDCVFCNQKKITARDESPTAQLVIETIERNLNTLNDAGVPNIEIGFFGGSFTGIPVEEQNYYLEIAREYKSDSRVSGIRLSTRPDYIDETILDNLKHYSVDLIELGVQSFDDEVLKLSERGHDANQVERAASLVKDRGFDLGIQLMIGLPGDTREKSVRSSEELVRLKPSVARLYPTVILKDTKLMNMYECGGYIPFSDDEMLETTTDMYDIITSAGINVIRIGLKSTDLINDQSDDIAGAYHPAFSELVQGQLFYRKTVKLIDEWMSSHKYSPNADNLLEIRVNPTDISKAVGHKGRNRTLLAKKYPRIRFRFIGDSLINSGSVTISS